MSEFTYFDRDLSWLSFNYRVLIEASDPSLPLYERIKFLAIYSSNKAEFFRVRVGWAQGLARVNRKEPGKLDYDPDARLDALLEEIRRQQTVFSHIFRAEIMPQLQQEGIHLLQGWPTEPEHVDFVNRLFEDEIKVMLHPELIRKSKIMHFLREGALYLAVKLRNRPRNFAQLSAEEKENLTPGKRVRYALVQIPSHYFPRFIELPQIGDTHTFIYLDDIIRGKLKEIFHGYDVISAQSIKVNRDADLQIEDEKSGNLVHKIQRNLSKRKTGNPVRFLYDRSMPKSMLKYLRDTFNIKKRELISGGRYHSYSDFFGFPNPHAPRLERKSTPPLLDPDLEKVKNMFKAIRHRNRLLHFPYHSYDYVVRFLNQAATDPTVEEMWTTQYRVASNSAIVNALIRAANNGKKVTVFVEIKARFDEASNLKSAAEMEQAGVNIIYSLPGLKVHAKVALVMRREDGNLNGYAFLSTGNFNEKTARIYGDHGFFTCQEGYIKELQEVFKHLQDRKYKPPTFRKLLVAQFNMRDAFVALIQREIMYAQTGKPAGITIKLNNLEDRLMIDELYKASNEGVPITLIVRGICCLIPGKKGQSENIRVIRIVDQFLEHARVFVFHNLGANDMYLGSADWMRRNLNRRIEVAFPLEDPDLKAEIMAILKLQLADNVKAVELNEELENIKIPLGEPAVRSQNEIYQRIAEGSLLSKEATE